jgi:hypothetical protein
VDVGESFNKNKAGMCEGQNGVCDGGSLAALIVEVFKRQALLIEVH